MNKLSKGLAGILLGASALLPITAHADEPKFNQQVNNKQPTPGEIFYGLSIPLTLSYIIGSGVGYFIINSGSANKKYRPKGV
jgi:hypothetical protein